MDADKRITFPELMSIFSGSDLAVSPVRCRSLPAKASKVSKDMHRNYRIGKEELSGQ